MINKIPQTKNDLKRQLSEQLQLLETSANLYDQGDVIQAKNMAVRLRTILYDSGKSQSLLSQLGIKSIQFADTAMDDNSNVITAHCALVHMFFGSGETKYVALLDDVPSKMTDYNSWWNKVIFKDDERNEISRKDIILTMTNQDGGAHVDPDINREYLRLSKGQSLGHMYSKGSAWFNMRGAELASVRQIAHEVLKTLKPNYTKKPVLPNGISIGSSIRFEFEEK
ncbi:MAG: hypothetical protein AABY27_01925 [Pseudomonadota bacterium]